MGICIDLSHHHVAPRELLSNVFVLGCQLFTMTYSFPPQVQSFKLTRNLSLKLRTSLANTKLHSGLTTPRSIEFYEEMLLVRR